MVCYLSANLDDEFPLKKTVKMIGSHKLSSIKDAIKKL